MIHNGIEYADMQLIRRGLRPHSSWHRENLPPRSPTYFTEWNKGELETDLVSKSPPRSCVRSTPDGEPLVDVIVDEAGSKGTGVWTVQTALALGTPVSGIPEAVFARGLSFAPRTACAGQRMPGPDSFAVKDVDAFIEDVRQALYASKIVAYSQGFDATSSRCRRIQLEHQPRRSRTHLARRLHHSCQFLNRITEAYRTDESLALLMAAPYFAKAVSGAQAAWRQVVIAATGAGIPAPSTSHHPCRTTTDSVPAAYRRRHPRPARGSLRSAHLQAHRQARSLPHSVVRRSHRNCGGRYALAVSPK